MKILVPVTSCVDLLQPFKISPDRQQIIDYQAILNPWDEFALEAALQLKDRCDANVIAISISSAPNEPSLRKAIAMGCDSAIQIGSEPGTFSQDFLASLITAAILRIGDIQLVCFGKQTIDFENGTLAALTSAKLGWPFYSLISAIEDSSGSSITLKKSFMQDRLTFQTNLPIVISISKEFAEPRFASFMGTRKAARAEIPVWSGEQLSGTAKHDSDVFTRLEEAVIPKVNAEIYADLDATQAVIVLEEKLTEILS